MRHVTRSGSYLAIGLVLIFFVAAGPYVLAEKDNGSSELPLEDLRVFSDVLERIKNDYVEPVDDKELLESAVRGMLSGLDPHSSYLDIDAFKELQVGTSGEFGGLGIEVGMEDGFVKVISPIDDTPAARAGVEAGDLIIRLDDKPVKGMSLSEAVKVMRGKKGSPIVLTIVREGEDKPLTIEVVRDTIQVTSVRERVLEEGIGYVRISQFQSKTSRSLAEAISQLKKESGDPLRGLVLDLRNNPGGLLDQSIKVSDAFLHDGRIVSTRERYTEYHYRADRGDIADGLPMVVLVNKGSASAAEIVAGALQDNGRAVVVGDRTFGKGTVQTIIPLSRRNAVKLTTAIYLRPSGRTVEGGIEPDQSISLDDKLDGDEQLSRALELLTSFAVRPNKHVSVR